MRAIGVAVLLLVLVGPAPAEDEVDTKAILSQLSSDDPAEAAWGAYRAGNGKVREAIPRLAELLRTASWMLKDENPYLRLAVLDALILLQADVPGDFKADLLLRHGEREFRCRNLILLSRHPEENREALLGLFQPRSTAHFDHLAVAIGNLLCGLKASDFTAKLLAGVRILHRVTVIDPGVQADGGFSKTAWPNDHGPDLEPPEGYPPLADYTLTSREVPGGRLLADGPRPIWYVRQEGNRIRGMADAEIEFHRREECTFEWLGSLLGEEPDRLFFTWSPSCVIAFQDRDGYIEKVRAARDVAVRPWFDLLDRCLRAKLLSPLQARRIQPDLHVHIVDDRKDQSSPLPVVRFPRRVFSTDHPGAGGLYGGRGGHRNLRALGGGTATEAAVDAGLDWLDRHQDGSGSWDSDGFSGVYAKELCPGKGKADLDVVNTSLALLAFLGAAETDRHGNHQRTVRTGLDWLLAEQHENGRFGPGSERLFLYDHILATLAIGEAYAGTDDPVFRESLVRGLEFLRGVRRPGGGWGNSAKPEQDDPAVTLWAHRVLRTARACGLEVAPEEYNSSKDSLDLWEKADFEQKGPFFPRTKPSLLALIIFCRDNHKYLRRDPAAAVLVKALAEPTSLEEWVCGTPTIFQIGGEHWKAWNQRMYKVLLPQQVKEGCERGSWNPAGFEDRDLGRVGVTACLIACLEVYYRYGIVF
jgi:hypothetical protein